MTKWTDFVKEYAKKKGISYGCALSQASADYQASKPKKPTKGTIQVKRNVAQRELEGISSKAKKQAYLKRVGVPEDLIQEYVNLNHVYYMYDGLEFHRTPKKVKNAIDKFDDVLRDVFRELSPGNEMAPGEFFEVDYDGSIDFRDLGFDDEDITWNSDATNYIKSFTADAKDLLKRIKASKK